jgi:tetratricopeptide (TPR) repeat protein
LTATNLFFAPVLLIVVLYVSTFAHEVGHALLGRAAGFAVNSFGLGLGRPWFVAGIGRTRVYLCSKRPFQGITFIVFRQLCSPPARTIAMLAGGLLVHMLLFLLAFLLWWLWPQGQWIWLGVAYINGLLLLVSAWPRGFAIGASTLRTDGMLIREVLRDRVFLTPPTQSLQMLSTFRDHWAAIGDVLTLRSYLIAGAFARIELEDWEGASQLLDEATAMGESTPSLLRGREALARYSVAAHGGERDRALEAITAAEDAFRAAGDDGGLLVVSAERMRMRVAAGDACAPMVGIDDLLARPLARELPILRESFLELKLRACVDLEDAEGAREVVTAYEARERSRRSRTRDLLVYKAMAGFYARQRDWESAEPAYRKGIEAIVSILESWPVAEEQRRFAERQSRFLDEVRECFHSLKKPTEAESLLALILTPEVLQTRAADAKKARDRRLFRTALWMLLVDFIGAGVLIWAFPGPNLPGAAEITTVFFFDLLCLFIAVVLLLFYGTIGWFFPRARQGSATSLLVLSLLPWVSVVAAVLFRLTSR